MKLPEAINVLKTYSADEWWPCPSLGRTTTEWEDVFLDAKAKLKEIMLHQGIEPNTPFFVLDPEHPETPLYGRIAMAILQVRSAINANS